MPNDKYKSWRKDLFKTTWTLFVRKKNLFWKFIFPVLFGGGTFICTFFESILEMKSVEKQKFWSVIFSLSIIFLYLILEFLYYFWICKRKRLNKLLNEKDSLMQDKNSLKKQNDDLANRINQLESDLSNSLDVSIDDKIMRIIKETENKIFPMDHELSETEYKEKLSFICNGIKEMIVVMKGETANKCCVSIKQLSKKRNKFILLQMCRDSSNGDRDDSVKYNKTVHYLEGNTPYKTISQNYCNQEIGWNETVFHYVNDDISNDKSFEITRKCIQNILPYNYIYACPALPLANSNKKANISGFLSIDHPDSCFFGKKEILYLNHKMERFANITYCVIQNIPAKTKTSER